MIDSILFFPLFLLFLVSIYVIPMMVGAVLAWLAIRLIGDTDRIDFTNFMKVVFRLYIRRS